MSEVAEKIAGEIRLKGVIPFARFMELALYCPDYGFYEKERDILGRAGHFYTSVSVGNLFGELLAFQFAEWQTEAAGQFVSGNPTRNETAPAPGTASEGASAGTRSEGWQIVEAGAHDGRLAGDVLRWLRDHRPQLYDLLQYCIVDPSVRRQAWQREGLAEFAGKVLWVRSLSDLAVAAPQAAPASAALPCRIIFCNELLDAMPVHRWAWDRKRRAWFEWGVALEQGRFVWAPMTGANGEGPPLAGRLSADDGLQEVLPDGFIIECCPQAEVWWRQAADALAWGKLLTIDYGLTEPEYWHPERQQGTLRAYRHHRSSADLLEAPGEQDLTAHVNFTMLQSAGEAAGLWTEKLWRQEQFFTAIAGRVWDDNLQLSTGGPIAGFGGWTSERTRQFQTLIHPEFLGRSFRVLVQARDLLRQK